MGNKCAFTAAGGSILQFIKNKEQELTCINIKYFYILKLDKFRNNQEKNFTLWLFTGRSFGIYVSMTHLVDCAPWGCIPINQKEICSCAKAEFTQQQQ